MSMEATAAKTTESARSEARVTSAMIDDLMATASGRNEVDTTVHKHGYTNARGVGGVIFHSVEHIVTPGVGNKIAAVTHAMGMLAAGQLVYTGVRWVVNKALGKSADAEVGGALP